MMHRTLIFFLIVFSVFSFSWISFVSAQTSTSTSATQDTQALIKQLQSLIISLQTQINDLKAKLEITQKEVEIVKLEIQFTKSLVRGTEGDEVKQLQEVLKEDPEIYPEGLVTGFFGPATEAAVKRFQEKHGIESLGIIGPKTRARLNELITQGAGKSGVIPPGLEKRFGTTTPAQIPPSSTPSGTIPAQSIGQTGTTTIPAIPAFSATTTIPVLTPIPAIVPPLPVIPLIPVQLSPGVATSTTNTSAYDAWYAITPPSYNIVVRSTSSTGAVINWNTKDASDSEIHVAASPISSGVSFTRVLAVPNSSKTFHEAIVSGLNSGTTYYYVVVATNTAGKITTSVESSFATLSSTSAVVPVPSSSTPTPSPSPTATTTTSTADTTAPSSPTPTPTPSPSVSEPAVYAPFGSAQTSSLVISNIQEYIGPTAKSYDGTLYATLYITWTTNAQATTEESYRSPDPVGDQSGALYIPVVTNHKTTIGIRSGSTHYYYQLKSVDANGNAAVSEPRTFISPTLTLLSPVDSTAPVISNINVRIDQISTGALPYQATISWTTDDPAHTGIFYSPLSYSALIDKSGGTWDVHTPLSINHTIITNPLLPNAQYQYYISSYNASGYETQSSGTFTTPSSSSPSPSPSSSTSTSTATTTAQQTSRDSLMASLHTLLTSLKAALMLLTQ